MTSGNPRVFFFTVKSELLAHRSLISFLLFAKSLDNALRRGGGGGCLTLHRGSTRVLSQIVDLRLGIEGPSSTSAEEECGCCCLGDGRGAAAAAAAAAGGDLLHLSVSLFRSLVVVVALVVVETVPRRLAVPSERGPRGRNIFSFRCRRKGRRGGTGRSPVVALRLGGVPRRSPQSLFFFPSSFEQQRPRRRRRRRQRRLLHGGGARAPVEDGLAPFPRRGKVSGEGEGEGEKQGGRSGSGSGTGRGRRRRSGRRRNGRNNGRRPFPFVTRGDALCPPRARRARRERNTKQSRF